MKINTLTEDQRLLLIKALSEMKNKTATDTEEENRTYLLWQLHQGKGTQ